MGECSHCEGTGQCQDDFHSGARMAGGHDEVGHEHPGIFDSFLGDCPSCGDWNANRRPACPHCDGTGQGDKNLFGISSDRSWLPSESVKERRFREQRSGHDDASDSGLPTSSNGQSSGYDHSGSLGGSSMSGRKLLTIIRKKNLLLLLLFAQPIAPFLIYFGMYLNCEARGSSGFPDFFIGLGGAIFGLAITATGYVAMIPTFLLDWFFGLGIYEALPYPHC